MKGGLRQDLQEPVDRSKKLKKFMDKQAQITLLLEGTYPYVRGGVSSWVHQIIQGMPEFSFAVIFIGSCPEDYGKMLYEFPDNVVHFECHYLQASWQMKPPARVAENKEAYAKSRKLHDLFQVPKAKLPNKLVADVLSSLGEKKGITHENFLYSRCSWDNISRAYERYSQDPSFLNYFWTVRSMHAPLFMLTEVARTVPLTPVIHSISTGYAGLLGAMIKNRSPNSYYLLSEHGIYSKERKIDLAQASWISDGELAHAEGVIMENGFLRDMWIRFFEVLSQLTYQATDKIFSLYEGNQLRQINDGADFSKTAVIANGISLERYKDALSKRPPGIPMVIGLIGRVVPIKDIKTFIRTIHRVRDDIPEIEGWIIGPEEEDPEYASECHQLTETLGLKDTVKFLGFQNVPEILPKLGLMALTSISEAQPLVILEAYAAGVPCVCTDVGSCREMVEGGQEPGDRELGPSGAIVNMADPESAARECVRLLGNSELWHQQQQAAIQRVKQFYTEEKMFQRYRDLYRDSLAIAEEAQEWPA